MKSTKHLNAEIEHRNKLFRNATAAQKRVLIAKDIIAQIRAQRLVARAGVYLDPSNADSYESSFQAEFLKPGSNLTCRCCAVGAMAASSILFKNRVQVCEMRHISSTGRIFSGDKDRTGLKKLFGKTQLALIEWAFEGWGRFFDWSNQLEDDGERLTVIMQNIIKNKGKFVSPVKSEYLE